MPGIFITGTDTDVGKTMVSCAIAAALSKRGLRVGVAKPIETGAVANEQGHLVGHDCAKLAAAAGSLQLPEELASYLFREPAAPLVAAAAEHAHVDPTRLAADVRATAATSEFMLVEGAGGIMVPIAPDFTYLELAHELALPIVVVVGSRLGCVNHALMTLELLERRGLTTAGWILNNYNPADPFELAARTNRELIASFTAAPNLGTFHFVEESSRGDWAKLGTMAEQALDLDALLR